MLSNDSSDPGLALPSENEASAFKLIQSLVQAQLVPLMALIGTLTNAFTFIIIVTRFRHKDQNCTQYLLGLSVADFCCCLYELVGQFANHTLKFYTNGRMYVDIQIMNDEVCKFVRVFQLGNQAASAWVLATYSMERCSAISQPLKAATRFTPRRRAWAITAAYLVSLLFASRLAFVMEVFEYDVGGYKECYIDPKYSMDLSFVNGFLKAGFLFIIPGCVMFFCNARICATLLHRTKTKSDLSAKNLGLSKAEMKCMVTLISISVLFIVAVTPTTISFAIHDTLVYIYYKTGREPHLDLQQLLDISYFCESLLVANNAGNFLIYTISLDWYRGAIKSLLCRSKPTNDDTKLSSSGSL